TRGSLRASEGRPSPVRGNRFFSISTGKSGFGERPAAPREPLAVPARELGDRHSVPRRVDEPAVAEVDAGVVDLGRPGTRPVGPEEEHVAGGELRPADAFRGGHFAAHLVRGAAAKSLRQRRAARVTLEL